MNSILTLDKLLDLPKEILQTSEKYNEYSNLLGKNTYKQYDFIQIKKDVNEKFNRFKDAKYLYKFPIENLIKTTPLYELKENSHTKSVNSQVESIVTKQVDEQIWVERFYDILLSTSAKLTMEEAIYLVDSFFANKSLEVIAERLQVCMQTIQNIKKSCLVKVWIELKTLDDNN